MDQKKWMTWLDMECWKWLKETTKDTGVPGGRIINELIAREMRDKSGKFKAMLAKTKMEAELQRIRAKRAELVTKEHELETRLKAEKAGSSA